MKSISCKDIPGNDGKCDHVVSGLLTEDCIDGMFSHAAQHHADMIANMNETQKAQMGDFMVNFLNAQE